jgi:hypothetical protein
MSTNCNHCGTELPDTAVFCLNCGKSVGSRPALSPAERPTHEIPPRVSTMSQGSTAKTVKTGIAAVLLLIAALAFWPKNYGGRFAPRPGTNFALDNKTGQSCRMSGERTPSEADAFFEKYRSKTKDGTTPANPEEPQPPPGYVLDTPTNPIPLCSEIIEGEKKRDEVITRFTGAGLLVLFGIYITVRHWKRARG